MKQVSISTSLSVWFGGKGGECCLEFAPAYDKREEKKMIVLGAAVTWSRNRAMVEQIHGSEEKRNIISYFFAPPSEDATGTNTTHYPSMQLYQEYRSTF